MIIKKGKHRPAWWWLRWPLWYDKKSISRIVTFTEDSKYDLWSEDQDDHNKLFGIGYFPGHHKESARFGWRYEPVKKLFLISAYCYVNGQRIMTDICSVGVGKYKMTLTNYSGLYSFDVIQCKGGIRAGNEVVRHLHNKQWSFPLGLYFGGNNPAPNDITIEIKKP